MKDNEAAESEPLSIVDAIREITDTGKRKALGKFIRIIGKQDTAGWTEEKYCDAWKVFQVAERLDKLENKQERRAGLLIKIWIAFKDALLLFAKAIEKIRIE